ncbi:fibrinogen-like YCDxxxxGGGW domain-containing protein [Phenylobacterium sp.]|uniref:fibrinogen-like YCDxxxxGGGW domain-containing protein n=1 Tax=Phenylobacterium sp. TaxID=1871053 RepID=UPI00374CB71A
MKPAVIAGLCAAAFWSSAANATPYASAKELLVNSPGAASGFYTFDPDGAGATAAFSTYADMTTAGGGWTLGLNSIHGSVAPSSDMVATLGAADLSSGFNRDLTALAVTATAQIRHVIKDQSGGVLFDGYYTGLYHDALPLAASWTILAGSFAAANLDYHLGLSWTTTTSDNDTYGPGNCADFFGGQPWYYGACWTVSPTGYTGGNTPQQNNGALGSYQIFVRETATYEPSGAGVPEPAAWALMIGGFGLTGAALRRRRAALIA